MNYYLSLFALLISTCDLLNGQTLVISPLLVNEGGIVTACVRYDSPPSTQVEIILQTRSGGTGAAQADADFERVFALLDFGPSSPTEQCRDISIFLDSVLEDIEIFDVTAANGTVEISGSPAPVAITSSDSVALGFGQTTYSYNEDESGMACVVIERGGVESNQGVDLSFTFSDGTATAADSDYDSTILDSITITVDRNTPSGGACFNIPITPDSRVESDETFTISLDAIPGRITLNATTSQALVTIVNDDADCPAPPALENGNFALTGVGPLSMAGDTANYTCISGYEVAGDSVLTCRVGNVWSPTTPGTCQGVDCGGLAAPANGGVTTDPSTRFPSVATYTCNVGHNLIGSETRNCQADTVWSGEAPTCQIVDCNSLMAPANGSVNHPQTTFMATATYSCNLGYIIEGQTTRMCQVDGTWSGSAPTCRAAAQCPVLDIGNGNVDMPQRFEGDMATYTCDTGFLLEGEEVRTCGTDGMWSGSAPTCFPICDSLTSPGNGTITHPGQPIYMSIATYSCNTGYVVEGQATRTCQANGTWSGSAPTCRVAASCPNLERIENGIVDMSQKFEGDVVTYSCDDGFGLRGDRQRTCGTDGEWSGSEPTCDERDEPMVGGLTLTTEDMIGIGVGVGLGAIVILVLVVVAVVVMLWFFRKRRADKYVLNYSTVYTGNQRKNELTSRPMEFATENDYGEAVSSSTHQESAVDVPAKP